ncbi:MAG: penicillin-binding transpeptidase domain-containing protein [Nocardioidaceae bacterium]
MGTRPARLSAAAVIGVTALAGCSILGLDDPSPEAPARDLAKALTSGELADVAFTNGDSQGAQKSWDEITGGMGDTPRKVGLSEVVEHDDGEAVTATLHYSWDLGARAWTYDATAEMTYTDDQWVVDFAPSLVEPSLNADETLELTSLRAQRGDILGADGTRVVTDRPVVRFGIDKTKVGEGSQAASARRLAALLEIDERDFVERVEAAGDDAFVEALVLRPDDVPPAVGRGYDSIRGALAVADEIPLAPTREFARPILGTVGPVTAEIIEDSGGKYEVGDEVGLSGLQQRYEDILAGQAGALVQAEETKPGGSSRDLFRVEPERGRPLRTSLDLDLQERAEKILADVGPASALVAIRPSDGHVLAAASGPGSDGYSNATIGRYAPGSTFKVVSSLALLRSGLTPETVVPCPRTLTVNGKSFKNYDDYPSGELGDIPLRTALAQSCNTAFIHERGQAEQSALADAAAALGLGVDHDLGFPVFLGEVPDQAQETEHAASMIGQGKVLASPMAMAAVVASVAEGETVTPVLLLDDEPDDIAPSQPLTGKEASQLRGMMRSVVTGGSGTFLADVPGDNVIAKTGTAEFGTKVPLDTHAWMIAAQGDLAVAAFVEVGDSGSHTAGPLLEELLRAAG